MEAGPSWVKRVLRTLFDHAVTKPVTRSITDGGYSVFVGGDNKVSAGRGLDLLVVRKIA